MRKNKNPFICIDAHACPESPDPDGIEESRHCQHLCFHEGEPSLVCCFCGDLFVLVADDDPGKHGIYANP
jgi:hypothetical protein